MGTAVTEEEEEIVIGKSFVEGAGNVSTKAAAAASACHSVWEVDGGAQGVTGARLSAGIAQQARPQHWLCFEPQHLRTRGTVEVALPADPAKTPCQEVTMPIRMASRIVTVLERRAGIGLWVDYFVVRRWVWPTAGLGV